MRSVRDQVKVAASECNAEATENSYDKLNGTSEAD